ncbi:MAG: DUF4249 domain-containing protein [Flavobacterium sp.]
MKKTLAISLLVVLITMINSSCTEPYALQTNTFEDAVVIEGTITNEFKKQEIKLTRTFRFEENGPKVEHEAVVTVSDNMGNEYDFEEVDGIYVSTVAFQAVPSTNYQLHITTNNGKTYVSSNEQLTTVNPIQNVTPYVTIKEGVRGVQMNVKSYDPTKTSKYYRYEYDETYKIIAPQWINIEAFAHYFPQGTNPPGELTFQQRTTEAHTCYSTEKSDQIILANTSGLSEDRVDSPVRFIANSNHIIMHRYSILVKQYVENLAAYTFYETLKKTAATGSILSQNQPGFFAGNIKCVDNPNEKVIGFFDVASYSEKRMFFNYTDIFPGEPLPQYPFECPDVTEDNKKQYAFGFCFGFANTTCFGNEILSWINSRQKVYAGLYGDDYILYPIQCGDCTSFSSNIKPLFWID